MLSVSKHLTSTLCAFEHTICLYFKWMCVSLLSSHFKSVLFFSFHFFFSVRLDSQKELVYETKNRKRKKNFGLFAFKSKIEKWKKKKQQMWMRTAVADPDMWRLKVSCKDTSSLTRVFCNSSYLSHFTVRSLFLFGSEIYMLWYLYLNSNSLALESCRLFVYLIFFFLRSLLLLLLSKN